MASIPQNESEALTRKVFILTMIGAVLFLLFVGVMGWL